MAVVLSGCDGGVIVTVLWPWFGNGYLAEQLMHKMCVVFKNVTN